MKIKKFPYKYGVLVWILLTAVTLMLLVAVGFNVYDAVKSYGTDGTRFAFSVAMAIVSFALFILSLSVAVGGRYVIQGGLLYCRFGFFYTKIDIEDVFQVTEFPTLNKLVVYLKGEKYSVIVIDKKYYQPFFAAMKEVNPRITFTVQGQDD